MRKVYLSIAAAAAVFALGLGGAAAQDNVSNNNTNGSEVNQNNQGQTGTGDQLNDSTTVDIGGGSNFIASPSDVNSGGTAAQSPFSTAVGGSLTEIEGNSAGGDIFVVDGDGAYGADGAVVEGALADGGGVAFGEGFEVDDNFAAVGGDGVAAIAPEELVEDGSALVIGNGNSTASANDNAAAVGVNGNAIVIDDGPDDGNVIGFNNTVAMSELDQEYSAPVVAGPSADQFLEDQADFEETFGLREPSGALAGSNQAYGTIETGNISNISATDVAGLNDMFFSTGVGNQGHIASVGAAVGTMNLGGAN